MRRTGLLAAAALALLALPAPAATPVAPAEQGRVILENFTPKAKMPPVQFDHWRHRARFTCRLCHVDIGFAMAAGETRVSAITNQGGFHCGACHDGKTTYRGETVFASCSGDRAKPAVEARCRRCHDRGDAAQRRKDFEAFAEGLPRRGPGGHVDWEEAEAQGKIRPMDFLEGQSIRRAPLRMDRDVAISSKVAWMSEVLFSHRKHAAWSGCEACHPEIFPSTRRGEVKYSMFQISSGEYCGVCHGRVAFPIGDCERCHVKPVR